MDSSHICLAVFSLDSALKKHENYYLQVFLKECKYTLRKELFKDFKVSSDDSDDSDDFDKEQSKPMR